MGNNNLYNLCNLRGVSGDESAVRSYISDALKEQQITVKTDSTGNLYAFKKGLEGGDKKIMLCAHMDEVGFIITGITDDGFLRFDTVGGIDERILPGSRVLIGKNRVRGCIGLTPIHLLNAEERKKVTPVNELRIDIGAQDKKAAESLVSPGDYCIFESDFIEFGDDLLKAKALDDRAGCHILMSLISKPLKYDTVFAFTVMEEIGLRGAFIAAKTVRPDVAIVVECTTACDFTGIEEHMKICELGKGTVISNSDGATIYNVELSSLAREIADKKGIKHQTKRMTLGGNDAGSIQSAAGGCKVLALSVPCRNIHTSSCCVAKKDIEYTQNLLEELLNSEELKDL